MAYASIWDFGGVTFECGTNSTTFECGIGKIFWTKVFSSSSLNKRTGRIILGEFLGWRVKIEITGLYNLEDGDSTKFQTLNTILSNNLITINPRDSGNLDYPTILFQDCQLTSGYSLSEVAKNNVGQFNDKLTFECVDLFQNISNVIEAPNFDLYVDNSGIYYTDDSNINYGCDA